MKKITWLVLILGFNLYSQCFDCNKNVGNWVEDYAMDIETLPDGVVYLVGSRGFTAGYINKYDFNCNLLWSKTFGYDDVNVQSATSDSQGNIYLIIENTTSTNAGLGPWNVSGWTMSPGINFYKLNPQGDIIWNRHIGPRTGPRLQNIVYSQGILYITGTFYDDLTFNDLVSFSHPYTDYPRAFIAKYDTDGSFIDATEHGNGQEIFGISEVDPQGNTYLTYNTPNHEYSKLDKIDADLNLAWSSTLTTSVITDYTQGIYHPSGIRFNHENQKLYIWGGMNLNVNIMGHPFFIDNSNGVFQCALSEFDASTGALTNIQRFDNNSNYSVPAINGIPMHRTAFMKEKDGDLYVLTSFRGTVDFPNGAVNSPSFFNGVYHSEELLLFKVDLSNFTPELILQSHGVQDLDYGVTDLPGNIVFNGDDLYLTASFSSKPLTINGSLINNNSGNNMSDGMLYKFNVFSLPGSGSIVAQHTCLHDQTSFTLEGSYDAVAWNFGEPTSADNVSNVVNPQHQYSSIGTYHVTAVVTCGANTQTIEKDVVITQLPSLNTIPAITSCEDSFGSGISSTFDTTQLQNLLVGAQPNVALAFFTAAGVPLPSPLPNPFTNTVPNGQTVSVRAFVQQNPACYVESTISFTTLPTVVAPTAALQQTFCVQQNATIGDLVVAESGVVWHDAETSGNILGSGTLLSDGTTYYCSLTNGTCESPRTPVTSLIQSTPAPTGSLNQIFCAVSNPTLSNVVVTGDNIAWYDSIGGNALPPTTGLTDGATYYATQTTDGCASVNYLAVTVVVQNTLNASDVSKAFCDQGNDGQESVDLSAFQPDIIGSAENYTFTYFTSLEAAENETGMISGDYSLTSGSHQVFVRVTSATGCHQIVKLSLELIAGPRITLPSLVPLCKNVGHVTIDAGQFDNYLWSTGETTSSISVSEAGPYWVTVTENHGTVSCSDTKDFNVFMSNVATVVAVQIQEWTSEENTIEVEVDVPGEYEYSLDGVNFQLSNTFTNLPPGRYVVYIRDIDGCGITTAEVVLLMYPKYFTPNGDGLNDYWQIKFGEEDPSMKVTIFDRYGKLIAKLNGSQQGWDGKFNGALLPSTDYWFIVEKADGNQHRGHFALKR
jgi:gliding motility-associated-like protein